MFADTPSPNMYSYSALHNCISSLSIVTTLIAAQLYNASLNGKDRDVLDLLARGVDPDHSYYSRMHSGFTPLMGACYSNHPLMAEHLLKWGARTDVRTVNNNTALHWACALKAGDCVGLLLAHNSPTGEPAGCVRMAATMLADNHLL